ncbi:MAG: hypothetical protein MI757_22760, partial [Pirellulales bacterium]|nr:hypothetical protein [Pirellulales bacterium]
TSIKCKCGHMVLVPTMRGIRDLEPVTDTSANVKRRADGSWGMRQALALAAMLIGTGALVTFTYLFATGPERPQALADRIYELNREQLDEQSERLSVEQSFTLWANLKRHGVKINMPAPAKLVKLRNEYKINRFRQRVALSIAAIGFVIAAACWFWPRGSSGG